MAYPTVSAPYGLQPVNRIDGMAYAGAIRQIPIAAGYATAIFNGDTVKLDTSGYLVADTGTNNATPCGVLVGCQYVNSQSQKVQAQYYPAAVSTAANLALAYVVDDPMVAFKVAVVSTGTTIGTVGRAVVGSNMALVQQAGVTTTGDSYVAVLTTSTSTTNTLPVRVIDVVPETATGADAFTEIIVKINTHQYNSTTGI
jgi:hypothetical protein